MSVMETEVIPGGWRYADLEQLPDDGHRYEIIDGTLLVNASPSYDHQGVVGTLHVLLRTGAPPDFRVLTAPFDVVLADDTVVVPDLVVARRAAFTHRNLRRVVSLPGQRRAVRAALLTRSILAPN